VNYKTLSDDRRHERTSLVTWRHDDDDDDDDDDSHGAWMRGAARLQVQADEMRVLHIGLRTT